MEIFAFHRALVKIKGNNVYKPLCMYLAYRKNSINGAVDWPGAYTI
jgi:hypothetical protein